MPVRDEPYGDAAATAFFGNLLFEGRELARANEVWGVDLDDVGGLLRHLGADCPGAISVTPEGSGPGKRPGVFPNDYEEIGEAELADIARSLHLYGRLPERTRDPSPVAGVQPKIALVEHEDRFWRPRAGSRAPTTHILKVSPQSDPALSLSCQARRSSAVAVSGERPRNAANSATPRMWALRCASPIPRIRMSSIIRRRSGLIVFRLIETSCPKGKIPMVSPGRPVSEAPSVR